MVHMECMCRAYGVHVSCHLVDEAEEVAGSSRLCDGDARARCAAQRERRRTEAGGIVTGGEGAQAHNVQRGGGGSAEGEDVTRVGRAAVVCEQERACYVQRMRGALCRTWHVQCVCVCVRVCMRMCMLHVQCMCAAQALLRTAHCGEGSHPRAQADVAIAHQARDEGHEDRVEIQQEGRSRGRGPLEADEL